MNQYCRPEKRRGKGKAEEEGKNGTLRTKENGERQAELRPKEEERKDEEMKMEEEKGRNAFSLKSQSEKGKQSLFLGRGEIQVENK